MLQFQSRMTELYWLEQTEANVPAHNDWLSQSEVAHLETLRFDKRRRDWRLGRWTAKLAVVAYRNLSGDSHHLRDVEIRPAPSGAPEVFLTCQPTDVTISISHRDGIAMCAVAPSSMALGCDLEIVEPRSDCFTEDYFTPEEREFVAQARAGDRSRLWALLWSGKESALKALRVGLRLDTRSVMVSLDEAEQESPEDAARWAADSVFTTLPTEANRWLPFHVQCTSDQVFHGWWQNAETFVRTVVAAPPPLPPVLLVA